MSFKITSSILPRYTTFFHFSAVSLHCRSPVTVTVAYPIIRLPRKGSTTHCRNMVNHLQSCPPPQRPECLCIAASDHGSVLAEELLQLLLPLAVQDLRVQPERAPGAPRVLGKHRLDRRPPRLVHVGEYPTPPRFSRLGLGLFLSPVRRPNSDAMTTFPFRVRIRIRIRIRIRVRVGGTGTGDFESAVGASAPRAPRGSREHQRDQENLPLVPRQPLEMHAITSVRNRSIYVVAISALVMKVLWGLPSIKLYLARK